ncbi:CIC11C00000004222 [Sungouiella intermedia]|uniref:CIC11C00000004222 n=1 Tax=Sungouiella intermedia TaxID=45354 RepID=A0A1L0BRR3_9ASCO|nr:CIC11C00000004222 [[Candida] intermedia]
MTTPESVSTDPSELVVVHVVVYSVPAIDFGTSEVVVKERTRRVGADDHNTRVGFDDPSELVVVHVVV